MLKHPYSPETLNKSEPRFQHIMGWLISQRLPKKNPSQQSDSALPCRYPNRTTPPRPYIASYHRIPLRDSMHSLQSRTGGGGGGRLKFDTTRRCLPLSVNSQIFKFQTLMRRRVMERLSTGMDLIDGWLVQKAMSVSEIFLTGSIFWRRKISLATGV